MKFEEIVRLFAQKDWFDFEMVHLLAGEDSACVHTELYRWRRAGKLIELRRGMFALAEPWRQRNFEAAALAGALYEPSYLSGDWALRRYGAFAATANETIVISSVTARPAKVFENAFGRYSYATLPRDLLFGSRTMEIGISEVRIAHPEKALLDYWFLEGGDWDESRIEASGLEPGGLDREKLQAFAARAGRPRLARAVGAFLRYAERSDKAAATGKEPL